MRNHRRSDEVFLLPTTFLLEPLPFVLSCIAKYAPLQHPSNNARSCYGRYEKRQQHEHSEKILLHVYFVG